MPPSRLEDRNWVSDGNHLFIAGPGLRRKLRPGVVPSIARTARGWKLQIYKTVDGEQALAYQKIHTVRSVVGAKQSMLKILVNLDCMAEKEHSAEQMEER